MICWMKIKHIKLDCNSIILDVMNYINSWHSNTNQASPYHDSNCSIKENIYSKKVITIVMKVKPKFSLFKTLVYSCLHRLWIEVLLSLPLMSPLTNWASFFIWGVCLPLEPKYNNELWDIFFSPNSLRHALFALLKH